MTYSFQVKNGDLSLAGPGGFATVSGTQKLVQDLKNWFLEARGTDPSTPDYGSTLDEGIGSDGTYITTVGQTITPELLLSIESECRRVLTAYQVQQTNRLRAEQAALGGRNTFSPGEILASVDSVNVQQFGDTVVAQIGITTGDGSSITFSQPLTS